MIFILPKVFAGLGYSATAQAAGINSGEGSLTVGGGKIPMPLPGIVKKFTLYGGVARDIDVTAKVRKNGTTIGLEVALAAGAAGQQVFTATNPLPFSAGDYLEYVFELSDTEFFPGLAISACAEIEADAILYGVSPLAGTIGVGHTGEGGALGNGSIDSTGSYSICALHCVLERLCILRFASQSGGAWTAWIKVNGVIQDGTGGTVDTTTVLDDADPDFVVRTFSLPLSPLDHVNVYYQRTGSEAAFSVNQFGIGVAVRPDTPGAFMFCGGNNDVIDNGLTWKWMQSAQEGPTIGDHTAPVGQRPFQITGLYVEREEEPGAGNSYIQTLLKNGEPTGLVVTISDAAVAGQGVGAVQYHAGDTLTLQIETQGDAPSGPQIHWAFSATLNPGVIGAYAWVHWPRRVVGT